MHQLAAVVLAAASLAAPALRAVCELSCVPASEHAAVSAPSCHETASEPAAVRLGSMEDCGDHAQLPAVAGSQRERAGLPQLNLHFLIEPVSPAPVSGGSRVLPAYARGSTSPPIPPGARILRV